MTTLFRHFCTLQLLQCPVVLLLVGFGMTGCHQGLVLEDHGLQVLIRQSFACSCHGPDLVCDLAPDIVVEGVGLQTVMAVTPMTDFETIPVT
jgi:hypothetical protein